MPGWRWLAEPRPVDRSTATGTLVFEVRVDESGAVTSIQKIASRSTFTDPVAERAYMEAIEKTEFEQIASMGTERGAVGHITFRIGAK
jgi:porphobilinogen deaminase